MKVEFTRAAVSQLASISAYLRERNPKAAIRIADAIEAAVDSLARAPYSGRKQNIDGVRKKVLTSTRYLMFYIALPDQDAVRILAIVHAAQQRVYTDS